MIPRVTITKDPGGNSGGGGGSNPIPPFPPTFALYTDDGSVPSSGTVTGWGAANIVVGTPKGAIDTVDGGTIIQFFPGSSVAIPSPAGDFLSSNTSEVILVMRTRDWDPQSVFPVMSTTAGDTVAGWQVAIADDSTNNGRYRKVKARIFNGSSFVVDEPPSVGFYNNNFIEGKWFIAVVNISGVEALAAVDGETAYALSQSFSFPAGTGNLVIGGGNFDMQAIVAKAGGYTTEERAAWVSYLATRFNVDLLVQVVGAPYDPDQYFAFPGLTALSSSLAVCYRAGVAHSGDIGTIAMRRTFDRGHTWTAATTIQSDNTEDSRDPCFSAQLLNGDYLLNYFLQVIGGSNGHETSFFRRSTDNLVTFDAPVQVTAGVVMGTTGFEACSAPMVQRANGNLLFPLYGKNDGDTHTSAWAIINDAAWAGTPTVVLLADGEGDGISYSEPGFCVIHTAHQGLNVGDILALVRDDTAGNRMWEFKSTNGGLAWTNLGPVAGFHSSGRSLTQLASGEIVGCFRPNDPAASLMRRTGTATWAVGQEIGATPLGVIDASMAYAGIVETSPGILTIVYSRETQGNPNPSADIVCRPDFPEWQLFAELPMVVTPLAATVEASSQTQITARGAAPFTYPFGSSGSGSPTCNSSGLYTAGSSNGTDVVNVTDINNQVVPVTFTVTGGSVVVPPTSIDAGNLTAWWDPDPANVTYVGGPGGAPNVSTWTASDPNAYVLGSTGSTVPVTSTALNGKNSITFDGATGYFQNLALVINDLLGAGSWTVGFAFIDTGSPAETGNYFTMAALLGSVNDGVFGLGTTATQVYAGQGDTGSGATYDIRNASAATAHYAVLQYDSVAGKIFASVDGSAFDAGTTVGVLGTSVQPIDIGKSGVVGAFFKGSLGDLAIWKSKLTGSNLTNLQTFLASRI